MAVPRAPPTKTDVDNRPITELSFSFGYQAQTALQNAGQQGPCPRPLKIKTTRSIQYELQIPNVNMAVPATKEIDCYNLI
jgi:hypothetical protein